MKKVWGTLLFICLTLTLTAQFTILGKVTQTNGEPVEGATIRLLRNNNEVAGTITNANGSFVLKTKTGGATQLAVEHIGLQKQLRDVLLQQANTVLNVVLQPAPYLLEPLELRAVRAGDKAPFAKTNLSKQYIQENNLGRDLPFILDQVPSVVVNSDAGNGLGYTGIRIRGSDASRINVTMNGIPYNDAESQGTFFVDLPDIASSLNSIQVQRGVGTSSNGAGAFGATINLSTNEFRNEAYGELNNSVGSFNTWKNTIKAGSGLLGDHFTLDTRLSRLTSDGYIDRASSNLQSLFVSGAYTSANTSLRLNLISGYEKTYQAWYGVPESLLSTQRTYNSAGTDKPGSPYDNETDNYWQDHYQLFFNQSFSPTVKFSTALFLTKGKGYYEQYRQRQRFSAYQLAAPVVGGTNIERTDLVRRLWLDNAYYGQIFSLLYKKNKEEITFGGGWNQYNGDHFGTVIWAQTGIPKDHRYYDVDATKKDVNVYTKWQHPLSNNLSAFADVQYRNVQYRMNGFRNNPGVLVNRTFNFVNPKAGLTYSNNALQAFVSYALANKEPNRDDFEAGIAQQPKAETLHDLEAGIEKRKATYSLGATFYYMNYDNQLVLTGKVNDVGAYTRQNISESYRLGVELQGSAMISEKLNVAANVAISRNKIRNFIEYIDDYDTGKQIEITHSNPDISFSPALIGGATLNLLPFKQVTVSFIGKYVSRQYLDNAQDNKRSLAAYYVQDVRVLYKLKNKLFKEWNFISQVNNVFNTRYQPNGYTFSYVANGTAATENYYFPMAGTNVLVGVNITL